ncbi:MAG: hypothetical protein WC179_08520 [Candidatus Cloacimonadaceae bacterium]
MPDIYKLSVVLEKKVNEGIDKLDKTDISVSAYDKTLTNIITSLSILEKITYKPKPKKETKPETKEKKEN